mgnify:CR=1 FL=1
MKLEIKHLAGYLPYGLICKSNRGKYYIMDIYSNMRGSGIEKREISAVLNEEMKPILRPLSDLTKEIEHNGEKFVFSDIYFSNSKIEKLQDKSLCLFENPLNEIDYNSVQTLIKYHFDIFGLIEKGLAIDINTLSVQNDG